MRDSKNLRLSEITCEHYEDLIGRIGDDYIEYRWKRNPVSFSHYRHTQKSVEFAFSSIDAPVLYLLEIGSGPGTWTDICLQHTKSLTIIDISSEMLNLVRKRFHDVSLNLLCGDFLADTIALPHSFDIIFSARAIEYMDDKGAMVAKSVQHLNPGGYLIIITKNPNWMDKRRDSKTFDKSRVKDIHYDWISWSAMEGYYRSQGLTQVTTYPVCLGSYYQPLKNKVGIKICDLIQGLIYRKKISPRLDFLAESYMTIGRKIYKG